MKSKSAARAAPTATNLSVGDAAPDFALKDRTGKTHSLDASKNEFTVVFFYPKDNTPGCTLEARGFSKDLQAFEKLGSRLIGISVGDEKTKEKFCAAFKLKVLLLSDPEFKVAAQYGVYGEKSFMGRKFMGIKRQTFVIDRSGQIVKIFENVKPPRHSAEVRKFLAAPA